MGSSEKGSKDVMSDIPTFSVENLQNNLKVIQNRSVIQHINSFSIILVFLTMCCVLNFSCLQPDVSVYHRWSPCRNNWIHRLDRFCVLLCGDADHLSWANGQGRILCRLVL